MPTTSLSPMLRSQLDRLARHIRRGNYLFGISCLVLIGLSLYSAFFLADYFFTFSNLAGSLACFVAVAGLWVAVGIVIPRCRRLDRISLAAIIEKNHPELEERLTTTVALAGLPDADQYGAQQLVAALEAETESLMVSLDVSAAYPIHAKKILAMVAAIALLLAVGLGWLWAPYADFGRRFLYSWVAHEKGAGAQEKSTIAIVPVKLDGSPLACIIPPLYVNSEVHPQQTVPLTDLAVLQYSRVELKFRFNRPALACRLDLKNTAANSSAAWTMPASLSADRKEASVAVPALAPGAYALTLTMEAENRVTTVQELPLLTVWADKPPVFVEAPGGRDMLAAVGPMEDAKKTYFSLPPDETLPLKAAVLDKVGLGRVEIEYRINEGPVRLETMVEGNGQLSVRKECLFLLLGKVKEGDVLALRIKAGDNRHVKRGTFKGPSGAVVPGEDLSPNIQYEPGRFQGKEQWFLIRIDARAKSFPEQGILANKERIDHKLKAIKKKVQAERAHLQKVRDTVGPAAHGEHVFKELKKLYRENRAVRDELHRLALEAAGAEGLQELAELAFDIAESELKESDRALGQAQEELDSSMRDLRLQKADQKLARAVERLDKLNETHERLAKNRLDLSSMENLAQRQENLGKETAMEAAQLQAEEEKLAKDLQGVSEKSPLFKEALQAAQMEQANKLADQAQALARAQQELNESSPARKSQDPHDFAEFGHKMRQEKLRQDAEKLKEGLVKLAQTAGQPEAKKNVVEAAHAVEKAMAAMKLTQSQKKMKEPGPADKAAAQAAQMLDKAGALAAMAGKRMSADLKMDQKKAGEALQKGQEEVAKAMLKLARKQTAEARVAMKQAAQSLRLAAKQAGAQVAKAQPSASPGSTNKSPNQLTAPPGSLASGPLPKDMAKYAGKAWGELPGQLRTRILQDMRARFGDDYARIIQRYFEKLGTPDR